jgi:hypothetical protein
MGLAWLLILSAVRVIAKNPGAKRFIPTRMDVDRLSSISYL